MPKVLIHLQIIISIIVLSTHSDKKKMKKLCHLRIILMKIHGTTVCLGQGKLGLEVADIQQLIVRGIWNATATD